MSRLVGELPIAVTELEFVLRTGSRLRFGRADEPTGITVRSMFDLQSNHEVIQVAIYGEPAFTITAVPLESATVQATTAPARGPWWRRWFT